MVQFQELLHKEGENGRFYQRPDGLWVPSVTTVLGKFKSPGLKKWQDRVGEEEATRIKNVAARRGTIFHEFCERFLKFHQGQGDGYWKFLTDMMPDMKEATIKVEPYLWRISNIQCQEACLYSSKFKIAGRVDCIGHYNGKLSIIDFKTSLTTKNEEWIQNYFEQESIYDLMYYEMTTCLAPQIVTIITSLHDNEVQVFIKNPKDHIDSAIEKIQNYEKLYDEEGNLK